MATHHNQQKEAGRLPQKEHGLSMKDDNIIDWSE